MAAANKLSGKLVDPLCSSILHYAPAKTVPVATTEPWEVWTDLQERR